jgi:hypothetical protein
MCYPKNAVTEGCETIGFCVPKNDPTCGGIGDVECPNENAPTCVTMTGVDDATGHCLFAVAAECVKCAEPECFE